MKPLAYTLVLSLLLLLGCNKDDEDPITENKGYTLPAAYAFDGFAANTSEATAQTAALASMVTEMNKGKTNGTTVSASTLNTAFNSGTISLYAITVPYYRDSVELWIDRMAAASGNTFDPGTVPGGTGGELGGRLFDRYGVELHELIDKGMYVASFYYRAAFEHLSGSISAEDIDRAFVYYGADVNFPNNNTDARMAKYAARRDNAGFYTNLKTQFLTARLAAAAGDHTTTSAAATQIKLLWEKAIAATAINYLYDTSNKLAAATTDSQRAAAWHSWAEGAGFLSGLRAVPQDYRLITTAKLDEVLGLMGATHPRTPTSFDTPQDLENFTTAINELAAVYGFSDPTIFQINDVTANGR